MPRLTLISTLLLLVPSAGQAITCEALQAQIDAKIKSTGVTQFALTTVDATARAPGRVIGQCERGGRKILYQQTGATAGQAAARAVSDAILTECKDGSVQMGGSCRK